MGVCTSRGDTDPQDLNALDYEKELKDFYVITVVFNPARSRNRIKLYHNFRKQMEKFGVKLITLECTYQDAPFTVTTPNYEPYNIQLKTHSPLFFKEHLVNVALAALPDDAKYVCFVDFEAEFLSPTWMNDTIKALHMFKAVQLFEDVVYLGPSGDEQKKLKSFASELPTRKSADKDSFDPITHVAGYAWGYRVSAIRELGGLFDLSIIGNSEKIMAYCLAGRSDEYIPSDISQDFKDSVAQWQKKAASVFTQGVGYVPGTIHIHYSSTKRDKKVYENWDILRRDNFEPKYDLITDYQGLYTISKKKAKLLEDMTQFFHDINGEMQDL